MELYAHCQLIDLQTFNFLPPIESNSLTSLDTENLQLGQVKGLEQPLGQLQQQLKQLRHLQEKLGKHDQLQEQLGQLKHLQEQQVLLQQQLGHLKEQLEQNPQLQSVQMHADFEGFFFIGEVIDRISVLVSSR